VIHVSSILTLVYFAFQYVGVLQEQLTELRGAPCKPTQETLTEYTRKVELLKGLIEAEKLVSRTTRAVLGAVYY
jgi:SNARE protein 1